MAWVTVDVELDEFSDEDIEAEYEARGLGNEADPDPDEQLRRAYNPDPDEQLRRAYMLHHQGKKDEAYAILWEMCLDKLNKVV